MTPCRKCGRPMCGPVYNASRDALVYTCLCGYTEDRPPLDRAAPGIPADIKSLTALSWAMKVKEEGK